VTRRTDVEALVQGALRASGRVDVLVNNAGLMPLSPFDRLKVDDWDRMIDVNIKGVLYGIAAALPIMKRQQSGHIINVSSVAGHKVRPGNAVYAATKHAVRAISEGPAAGGEAPHPHDNHFPGRRRRGNYTRPRRCFDAATGLVDDAESDARDPGLRRSAR
jgi:NAD(P)-dependent dehydrogenase (short-subunit alcohol dehydrogenase family)